MTLAPKSLSENGSPQSSETKFADAKRLTREEFVALGEGPPYYEFEAGNLVPRNGGMDPMVSPKSRHQKLLFRLMGAMDRYVATQGRGEVVMEVDVYLPDGSLVIPDITFVSTDGLTDVSTNVSMNVSISGEQGKANDKARLDPADDKVHGVPEMVVEILSDNAYRDRVHKSRIYQRNGVAWYWIIDPDALTIEEYHFLPDGTTTVLIVDKEENFHPVIFPRLTLNLTALMGEPSTLIDKSSMPMNETSAPAPDAESDS